MKIRGDIEGPLFTLGDGRFVTRKYVVSFMLVSLRGACGLNTHSFRIGGASAAASAGVPDSVIKIMGRWSSDCYRRYLHVTNGVIGDSYQKMTDTANHNFTYWDVNTISD